MVRPGHLESVRMLDGRAVLTIPEVALILRVSTSSAYEAAHKGEIPVRKIGRRLVIPVPAMREWLGMPPSIQGPESSINGQAIQQKTESVQGQSGDCCHCSSHSTSDSPNDGLHQGAQSASDVDRVARIW